MAKTLYKKETKRRSLFDSLRAITPDKLQYWPPKLVQAFLATSKTPIPIFSFNGSLQKKLLAVKSKSTVANCTAHCHQAKCSSRAGFFFFFFYRVIYP
jgi:hypothetical protein